MPIHSDKEKEKKDSPSPVRSGHLLALVMSVELTPSCEWQWVDAADMGAKPSLRAQRLAWVLVGVRQSL